MSDTPMHVFIIPDGNRRWERSFMHADDALNGHRAGYEVFKKVAKAVWSLDVTHLTFWCLSLDNIEKRSPAEVALLLELLRQGIAELRDILAKEERKIRFRVVGDTAFKIPWPTLVEMDRLVDDTKHHADGTLTLLVAYDGAWDLETAFRQARGGNIRAALPSGFLPDVDLMIRTGELDSINCWGHLSGAALALQMANAEIRFTSTFWPEFSVEELEVIIREFRMRQRRLGA